MELDSSKGGGGAAFPSRAKVADGSSIVAAGG